MTELERLLEKHAWAIESEGRPGDDGAEPEEEEVDPQLILMFPWASELHDRREDCRPHRERVGLPPPTHEEELETVVFEQGTRRQWGGFDLALAAIEEAERFDRQLAAIRAQSTPGPFIKGDAAAALLGYSGRRALALAIDRGSPPDLSPLSLPTNRETMKDDGTGGGGYREAAVLEIVKRRKEARVGLLKAQVAESQAEYNKISKATIFSTQAASKKSPSEIDEILADLHTQNPEHDEEE